MMDVAIIANLDPKLVCMKVAALRLGVSVRTLYRIIAEGGLLLVHIRGCSRLKDADLIAYIEKNTQG